MALTKRGQMIYSFFKAHPTQHPTAEEIYDELKKQDGKLGVATIYRNLKHLVEQGLIREINIEKQGVRYDFLEVEHYHFICDCCGNIENIELPDIKHIHKTVEQKTNGIVKRNDLLFHGICKNCLK